MVVKGVRDPSRWFRIASQNLIVYSDNDPEQVVELVHNLERLDYLLRLYLKPFLDVPDNMPKLTLYFEKRGVWPLASSRRVAAAPFEIHRCESATQAFLDDAGKSWKLDNSALLHADDDYTLMYGLWLYAEYFVQRYTRIRGPEWFMLGLVAYFGGARFTDTQMAVGRDAGTSYNLLQRIDDDKARARLSFDKVFRHKPASRPILSHTQAYYEGWEFLGRSFNLVHYMLSTEKNRETMVRYLNLVNEGADQAVAFADIFGLAGRDLEVAMWHYRRKELKILQVDVPGLPRATIDFTRLSRVEGEVILDNAMLKTCPAPAAGKQLLARLTPAAAAAPTVDMAQLALSRAQIAWGDPRDAIGYLARAVASDPYDPEPHYLLGLAYAKLADGTAPNETELLARARDSLAEARVLAPEAPEIAYALFRVELMGAQPGGEVMAKAIDAWRRGHDVAAFARAAALAYAWLGDAAGAHQTFVTLLRNARDPDNAAWAASWLARLEKGVPRDELLAALRRKHGVPSGLVSR